MAQQRVNMFVFLALCCFELVVSQSSKQISGSDAFPNVRQLNEGEAAIQVEDYSEVLLKDSPQVKSGLIVNCTNDAIKAILPSGSRSLVNILGSSVIQSVLKAPRRCGYSLTSGQGHNILLISYTGCYVTMQGGRYTVRVLYPDEAGQLDVATLSCDAKRSPAMKSPKRLGIAGPAPSPQRLRVAGPAVPPKRVEDHSASPKHLNIAGPAASPRLFGEPSLGPKGAKLSATLSPPPPKILPLHQPGGCSIPSDQRVSYGISAVTQDECQAKGLCFDEVTSGCYYPLDRCTADKHFVFAVHKNFTNLPVDPRGLSVAGNAGCKPVIANDDFAIFKFSVDECGTRSFVIGETTVFLAEVRTVPVVLNLKYGMISRDKHIRLIIECRYTSMFGSSLAGTAMLASAGYMVRSPVLPAYLQSEGLFGVQLLIAEDETFTTFYPHDHLPLNVLLGNPVYLELRLKSPKPEATLLVHYCVAYSKSVEYIMILLFEGCANPHDSENTGILYMDDLPQNRHQRRFVIRAFQFLDQSTNQYLDEEIYLMCTTEVCMPSDVPCKDSCFDGQASAVL